MLDGKADAGLLIHEGQLTYQDEGLRKIVDLGEWWAEKTGGLPLPLGGNIIRRDLGPDMIRKVSKLLHDSIAYALSHRKDAVEYAEQFGRGLDREKTDKFVGMYVNDLTLGYGERGRKAVELLFSEAFEKGLIPHRVAVEFATYPMWWRAGHPGWPRLLGRSLRSRGQRLAPGRLTLAGKNAPSAWVAATRAASPTQRGPHAAVRFH